MKTLFMLAAATMSGGSLWAQKQPSLHSGYPIDPVPFTSVKVTDHFWGQRLRASREVTIPLAFSKCEETGRYENFVKAAHPSENYKVEGLSFDDTDVYKTIAEMALVKLYLTTGDKKYLDQAKFFLDARGHTSRKDAYSQAHKPVLEQDEAVGHAVRAAYMYSGMADVAAITGDSSYIKAVDKIWDNIVSKKIYLTGGIGARHAGEAFGDNYELPNHSAYCETCAAIGNVYMNYRLFLLHGDAKYFDVLERTLYNGLISGVSLDGGAFFYPNPLTSHGGYSRKPWFGCACCPSNISRFIPSLPGYVYAVKKDQVYVNLYLSNKAELKVNNKKVLLEQETGYPWKGDIRVLLQGIHQLTTNAQSLSYDKKGKLVATDVTLTLIPYYAWAHRGEGDMQVWLPIDVHATSALPQKAEKWEDNGFFEN